MNTPTAPTRRLTKQRKIILEELCKVTSHPTADEIYDMVRQKLPKISLGTVYRNLEVLNTDGLIQIIRAPGGQKRFDGDTRPHHHIRCVQCGCVGDVFNAQIEPIDETHIITTFKILGHTTFFYGVCPQCARNNAPESQTDTSH